MTRIGRRPLKTAASCAVSALLSAAVVVLPTDLSHSASAQTVSAATSAMPEALADSVEVRIAGLHQTLRIVPLQEPVFRTYADVMRTNAQAINALFVQRAYATDFTAPARLHWYAQLTAAHAEAVNKLIVPFDALYQSLSPAQQRAADRHFERLQQRRVARPDR